MIVPKFKFDDMLRSIIRFKIDALPLVPPMAVLLCKVLAELSTLSKIHSLTRTFAAPLD